jgi:hypothetical protein
MNGLAFEQPPVVTQNSKTILRESTTSDAEPVSLGARPLDQPPIIDEQDAVDHFDLFTWKADDSFNDQFLLMPDNHQVAPFWGVSLIGAFIGQEKVAVTQRRSHTFSHNEDEAELALQKQ